MTDDCVPEITSLDCYKPHENKLKANVKWLISKAVGVPAPEFRDPFYRTDQGELTVKPPVLHYMTTGEWYCSAAARIFDEQGFLSANHAAIMQYLKRMGAEVESETEVTETILSQSSPPRLDAHMAMIDALMYAFFKKTVTSERVIDSVKTRASYNPDEVYIDANEDALVFWINAICAHVRCRCEQEGIEAVIPELDDLFEDWFDFCCVATVISFYKPNSLHFNDILLVDDMSVANCLANIQLVRTFCRNQMPVNAFHFEFEDVLYTHESFRSNIVAFLADVFAELEGPNFKPEPRKPMPSLRGFQQPVQAIPDLRGGPSAQKPGHPNVLRHMPPSGNSLMSGNTSMMNSIDSLQTQRSVDSLKYPYNRASTMNPELMNAAVRKSETTSFSHMNNNGTTAGDGGRQMGQFRYGQSGMGQGGSPTHRGGDPYQQQPLPPGSAGGNSLSSRFNSAGALHPGYGGGIDGPGGGMAASYSPEYHLKSNSAAANTVTAAVRLQLEEKRRAYEAKRAEQQSNISAERDKLGKAAFFQALKAGAANYAAANAAKNAPCLTGSPRAAGGRAVDGSMTQSLYFGPGNSSPNINNSIEGGGPTPARVGAARTMLSSQMNGSRTGGLHPGARGATAPSMTNRPPVSSGFGGGTLPAASSVQSLSGVGLSAGAARNLSGGDSSLKLMEQVAALEQEVKRLSTEQRTMTMRIRDQTPDASDTNQQQHTGSLDRRMATSAQYGSVKQQAPPPAGQTEPDGSQRLLSYSNRAPSEFRLHSQADTQQQQAADQDSGPPAPQVAPGPKATDPSLEFGTITNFGAVNRQQQMKQQLELQSMQQQPQQIQQPQQQQQLQQQHQQPPQQNFSLPGVQPGLVRHKTFSRGSTSNIDPQLLPQIGSPRHMPPGGIVQQQQPLQQLFPQQQQPQPMPQQPQQQMQPQLQQQQPYPYQQHNNMLPDPNYQQQPYTNAYQPPPHEQQQQQYSMMQQQPQYANQQPQMPKQQQQQQHYHQQQEPNGMYNEPASMYDYETGGGALSDRGYANSQMNIHAGAGGGMEAAEHTLIMTDPNTMPTLYPQQHQMPGQMMAQQELMTDSLNTQQQQYQLQQQHDQYYQHPQYSQQLPADGAGMLQVGSSGGGSRPGSELSAMSPNIPMSAPQQQIQQQQQQQLGEQQQQMVSPDTATAMAGMESNIAGHGPSGVAMDITFPNEEPSTSSAGGDPGSARPRPAPSGPSKAPGGRVGTLERKPRPTPPQQLPSPPSSRGPPSNAITRHEELVPHTPATPTQPQQPQVTPIARGREEPGLDYEQQKKKEEFLQSQLKRRQQLDEKKRTQEAEQAEKRLQLQRKQEDAERKKLEKEMHRQKVWDDYQKKKADQELLDNPASQPPPSSAGPLRSKPQPSGGASGGSGGPNRGSSQPPVRPKSQIVQPRKPQHEGSLPPRRFIGQHREPSSPVASSTLGRRKSRKSQFRGSNSVDELDNIEDGSQGSDNGEAPASLKLFVKPTAKSNRSIIINALQYSCLAGVVNDETKRKAFEELAKSDSKHFLVLFRDHKSQFRGLYSWDQVCDTAVKLYGQGPKTCNESMMDLMFKYDSGAKQFSKIPSKHLSATIDGFTIHDQFWVKKKVPGYMRPVKS